MGIQRCIQEIIHSTLDSVVLLVLSIIQLNVEVTFAAITVALITLPTALYHSKWFSIFKAKIYRSITSPVGRMLRRANDKRPDSSLR